MTDVSLSLSADLGNLIDVQAFACDQAKAMGASDALCPKLELVMEELFVNIVNHAQPTPEAGVEILCSRKDAEDAPNGLLCISLRDWGPPFNPLEKEEPSLEQDVDLRPIGGLGIFLVTQMADECTYDRQDETNLFTVCFKL